MGDPTHDKVMWRRPDKHGGSGLEGLPWTCSSIYPETKICLSPVYYIMPFTNSSDINRGYPRPPFSEENQLRALVNKSPGHSRSVSIQTPLMTFSLPDRFVRTSAAMHVIVHSLPTREAQEAYDILTMQSSSKS